jgi:hypothetical protein
VPEPAHAAYSDSSCDLREREDEVEEELDRRGPLLTLDLLLAHSRTLPRTGCGRE